ncbi:MAG: hypothetical protein KA765_01235 [Thermoflexales bacterium]|nr:hypothetical protein [Thermoflexales bacterium]
MPELPRTADQAYSAVNPDLPLQPGDPRWVDLNPVRGGDNLTDLLCRRITRSQTALPVEFQKQLVTGHIRSGKTTELLRLQHALEANRFCVVYFDVLEELGADVSYIHVLLTMAEQIVKQINASKWEASVKAELLQDLVDWFSKVIITNDTIRGTDRTLDASYGLGLDTPLLKFFSMFATLRGQIRNSSQRREEITRTVERNIGEFIERLNLLIDDTQVRLSQAGSAGLVLVVDSLEKMLLRESDEAKGVSTHVNLFIYHGEQLKAPRCHIIYTVPITLLSDQNVHTVFESVEVIPMVKIAERNAERTPYESGRAKLGNVIGLRVDTATLFQSPDLLNQLIDLSGGHVGDLLTLIRYALDYTETIIGQAQVERAARKMLNDKDRLITEDNLPDLVTVYRNQETDDAKHAKLLRNLLVLEYMNGGRWADVHPAVRANPRFQAALAPKAKTRAQTRKKK